MPDWSFPEFEWDDGNAKHIIERQGIYPEEAEEVFYNGAYILRAKDRCRVLGQDGAGRYLFSVYIGRDSKLRVISARDMTVWSWRFYERNS